MDHPWNNIGQLGSEGSISFPYSYISEQLHEMDPPKKEWVKHRHIIAYESMCVYSLF